MLLLISKMSSDQKHKPHSSTAVWLDTLFLVYTDLKYCRCSGRNKKKKSFFPLDSIMQSDVWEQTKGYESNTVSQILCFKVLRNIRASEFITDLKCRNMAINYCDFSSQKVIPRSILIRMRTRRGTNKGFAERAVTLQFRNLEMRPSDAAASFSPSRCHCNSTLIMAPRSGNLNIYLMPTSLPPLAHLHFDLHANRQRARVINKQRNQRHSSKAGMEV